MRDNKLGEMPLVVHPFMMDCSEKVQALKVLEEAAEVFGAWQRFQEECEIDAYTNRNELGIRLSKTDMADEIADVIQAACNLAARYRIDMGEAMERCTQRQIERGRL